ncbi:hypothetical protein [Agarilytica rhodophyticola]|uniref:hypothetical protein n=1 Tax=Agarilytica rhodophyticola TaxID=1737490 RepID=UPI001319DD5C|nr:hypothetical protein [Agarilytica rhodophyticola]
MKTKKRVLLELDQTVLLDLIKHRVLSLNDFRCLDKDTKRSLWQSYLQAAKLQVETIETLPTLNVP